VRYVRKKVWLAIRFKITTGYTWVFLPRILAMKITLTKNHQYGGSGEMACLALSAI